MASLPQPGAHPLLHRWPADYDMTGEGADLDTDAAAQLASEASCYSLSCSGSNAEASRHTTPDADPGVLPSFETHSPASAQQFPHTEESERWLHGQNDAEINAWQELTIDAIMGESHLMITSTASESGSVDVDIAIPGCGPFLQLSDMPNEVLLQILGHLDVSDLLSTSRTSHHLRQLSLAPILHRIRLQRTRAILPPMLTSPSRPSLADLISRSIFLTHTTVVSRKLARSLVSIRLQRRLAARPSAEALVTRCVLPPECVPGGAGITVAPALVAKKRAIERERVKDGLRRWVGSVWRGEVRSREEGIRMWEERVGVGRVWRLRRFWERVGS